MSKKYRRTVNKPLAALGHGIQKLSSMNAQNVPQKILKGAGIVGMGLAGFMIYIAKMSTLDNKLLRRLEKKLSEIKVSKDKDGYEKKFRAFVKRNPNLSAIAIWWAMLAMLIGGADLAISKRTYKDPEPVKKEVANEKPVLKRQVDTVNVEVANKLAKINKRLDTPVKITSKNVLKQMVLENLPYVDAVLFGSENYRTDWFSDKYGNVNTLGVGLFYVPVSENAYNFKTTEWGLTRDEYKKYPKCKKTAGPRPLTDDEVYQGIEGWLFNMDYGYNFNVIANELVGKDIDLTPRDLSVIISVHFNSPECCRKFCRFIVKHPENRNMWAKYLLRVDDEVNVSRLKDYPGLKGRRVHEMLLLLNHANYGQDMFGVRVDGGYGSAVSYANNYFNQLRNKGFSLDILTTAKRIICKGVVANGKCVCEWAEMSRKYSDGVLAYCADVEKYLTTDSRQQAYDKALKYYKAKDYDNALIWFNKVIELEGVSPELYNDLAITYIHQGYYDESIEMSKLALEIGSDYNASASYFNLGLAYEKKGNMRQALVYYRLAMNMGNGAAQSKIKNWGNNVVRKFFCGRAKVQQNSPNTSRFARGLFNEKN